MAATEHDRKARAYFLAHDFERALNEARLAAAAWERVAELET